MGMVNERSPPISVIGSSFMSNNGSMSGHLGSNSVAVNQMSVNTSVRPGPLNYSQANFSTQRNYARDPLRTGAGVMSGGVSIERVRPALNDFLRPQVLEHQNPQLQPQR